MKLIALIISATCLLSSCEKFLEYQGEDATPRLVVNGAFTPDSVFSIEMSNSLGYIQNGNLGTIANGQVAVYDGNDALIETLIHTGNGIYKGTTLAEANQMYRIEAGAPGFAAIKAQDIAPPAVAIADWDTSTISVTEFDFTTDKLQIVFTLNDPSDMDNFYILELYNILTYYVVYDYNPQTGMETTDTVFFDNPVTSQIDFSTTDPVLISDEELSLDQTQVYSSSLSFNDLLFDGRLQQFKILVDSYYTHQTGNGLELRLISCSEAYYKYRRTLQAFYFTDGDPFAQPVQVYTNVSNNGLGIWAGYSFDSVNF